LLLAVVGWNMFRCARITTNNTGELGWLGFVMLVGMVFFVLCCFIENYAEFCQAIFIPFILFIVAGSRARTLLQAAKNSRQARRTTAQASTKYPIGLALSPRFSK